MCLEPSQSDFLALVDVRRSSMHFMIANSPNTAD